jgi:hypothetical protein
MSLAPRSMRFPSFQSNMQNFFSANMLKTIVVEALTLNTKTSAENHQNSDDFLGSEGVSSEAC